MWYKILISTIFWALIANIQITLLGGFGDYLASLNLLLVLLVALLFFIDFKWIVYFTILAGAILDIYSSLPFGIFMVSFFIAMAVSDFLLLNFLTNKSFYSLVSVGLSAVIVFNMVFLISTVLVYLFGFSDFFIDRNYWLGLVYQVVNMVLFLSIWFFIVNLFSRQFKPNFIRS